MAHPAQMNFVKKVKEKYPKYFKESKVLEIGSLNVNGSFREMFSNCNYTGVDIVAGKDVDIVMPGHEFKSPTKFDVVCSGECFEHDEFWEATVNNMYKLLKKGGLFFFTCATTGRDEHGTRRTGHEWGTNPDYYRNLTEKDFRALWDVESMFYESEFLVYEGHHDLYFVGVKK